MNSTLTIEQPKRQLSTAYNTDFFEHSQLDFHKHIYHKGKPITSPSMPIDDLFFITKGTICIYALYRDRSLSPVNQQSAPTLIGDMEFVNPDTSLFCIEASQNWSISDCPFPPTRRSLTVIFPFSISCCHPTAKNCNSFLT